MARRKKKLTREQRAEMPPLFGMTGVIAMEHVEKKHRNKKRYDRKKDKKRYE